MKKDNAEIIYHILMDGGQITKDGKTYAMNDEGGLSIRGTKYEKGNYEDVWLDYPLYMKGFYRWCQDFTKDEISIIVSNHGLNNKGQE